VEVCRQHLPGAFPARTVPAPSPMPRWRVEIARPAGRRDIEDAPSHAQKAGHQPEDCRAGVPSSRHSMWKAPACALYEAERGNGKRSAKIPELSGSGMVRANAMLAAVVVMPRFSKFAGSAPAAGILFVTAIGARSVRRRFRV